MVVSLPMRDGNAAGHNAGRSLQKVVSLPMRDGNLGNRDISDEYRRLLAYL